MSDLRPGDDRVAPAPPRSAEAAPAATPPPSPRSATPTAPAPETQPGEGAPELKVPKTRTSATWVAVGAGLVLLLLVIVFIAQNQHDARLDFLWIHGDVPVGITILLAFVVGGLVVLLLGVARLAQLRLAARRHRKADDSVRAPA